MLKNRYFLRLTPFIAVTIFLLVATVGFQLIAPQSAEAAVVCTDTNWSVATEADLNAAITCFNAKAAGTYTISLTGDIDLTASTTQIINATAGANLIIDGAGFELDGQTTSGIRPLNVGSSTVVKLQNLIVTRGNAGANGGGILSVGSLTIDQSVISFNIGLRGGGIYSTGPLTITNSTLQDNRAQYTGSGSGIGGAIEHNSNPIYMANSTATRNTSDYQNNSVVRLNSAAGTFNHVTIHGNFDRGFGAYQSTSTLSNSIIADNGSGNCEYNTPTSGGYNIISDATCAVAGTGDLQNADPQLGTLQDNGGVGLTLKPDSGSPAIGMIPNGTNGCGSALLTDQAGVSRPNETGCEPGSIEFTPPPPGPISVNTTADVTADDGQCTLREAITAANTDTASGVTAGECTAGGSSDTIEFNIGGGGAQTITPASALPTINSELNIDGTTQPSYAGTPLISINPSGTVLYFNGASNSTIEALNLSWTGSGTNGTGLLVQNSTNVTLQDNVISLRTIGISVSNGSDVRVENNDLTDSGKSNNYALTLNGVGANTLPRRIEVSGNIFGNNQNGIALISMSDQIISDGSYPGTNVTIEDSSGITTATGIPLYLSNVDQTIIDDLDLSYSGTNAGTGLSIINGDGMTVTNNTINQRTIGISVSNGSDVRVENNNLADSGQSNNYALIFNGVGANTLPRRIEVSGNIFGNNQNGISLSSMTDQIISDGAYPGTNITIEDSSGITTATGTVLNLSNVDQTIIDDLDLSYTGTNAGTGLRINGGDGMTVTNNTINQRRIGISVSNGSDVRVENNDLTDSGKSNNYALTLNGVGANTLPRRIEVSGNIFGNNQNGIALISMSDQIISDGSYPGTNVTIEDSSGITTATGIPLYLSNVDQTIIDDLDLSYSGTNAGTGLSIINGDGMTVTNNTINQRTIGISVSNGSDVRVENNNLADSGQSNNYALIFNGVGANTLPRRIEVSGNIFGNNQNGISLSSMTDQIISDGAYPGTNITIEDSSGITTATGTVLNLSNVDQTIIDDLDLSYSGTNAGTGLRINGGDGMTVTNNTINQRRIGISVSNGSDVRVENNDLTDSGKSNNYALTLNGVGANTLPRRIEVSGNIFGNNQNGIALISMSDQIISDGSYPDTNVTIEDSSGITVATGIPLYLSNVDQTIIDDLDLSYSGTNAGTGLSIINGDGMTVTNNTINQRTIGISVSNGSDVRVENNNLADSGQSNNYALIFNGVGANTLPRRIEVSGNIFGNNQNGISLSSMTDQIISDGAYPGTNITIEDSSGDHNRHRYSAQSQQCRPNYH